ncbi:10802_t:CDS:10, partial [Acaulospora morrowiae]
MHHWLSIYAIIRLEYLPKRVYVGGLSKDITEKDLKDRFSLFGTISNIDVIRHSDTGDCRGFAYITINTTENDWKKCISLFNGTKWKGMTLTIQDAKPDYKQRLKEEWAKQETFDNNVIGLSPVLIKKRNSQNFFTKNEEMNLVSNNGSGRWNIPNERTVAMMHGKDSGVNSSTDSGLYNGSFKEFSEKDLKKSKVKAKEEKFFGKEARDIESNKNSNVANIINPLNILNNRDMQHTNPLLHLKSETTESLSRPALPPSIIDGLKKLEKKSGITSIKQSNQSNQIRLEALKQRALERKTKLEKVTQSLRNDCKLTRSKGRLLFSDNEDLETEKSSGKINLFDSDSEGRERSMDIVINPIFEGVSGRERLNIQKKFRGDERFKLTEDFVSEDDADEKNHSADYAGLDHEITRFLEKEKSERLGILNELLGDGPKSEPSKKKSKEWKEMIHFDPDIPEAKLFEIQRNGIRDSLEPVDESKSFSKPLPTVSKEVKVEINTDLKGIFAPGMLNLTSLRLFSSNGENEKNLEEINETRMTDEEIKEPLPS